MLRFAGFSALCILSSLVMRILNMTCISNAFLRPRTCWDWLEKDVDGFSRIYFFSPTSIASGSEPRLCHLSTLRDRVWISLTQCEIKTYHTSVGKPSSIKITLQTVPERPWDDIHQTKHEVKYKMSNKHLMLWFHNESNIRSVFLYCFGALTMPIEQLI